MVEPAIATKAGPPEFPGDRSIQSRFTRDRDTGMFFPSFQWSTYQEDIPPWGLPARDPWLRAFWKTPGNDILQGAVSSMIKKIKALNWFIQGGERLTKYFQQVLAYSEGGHGWDRLLSKIVEDYLTLDRGAFIEVIHETDNPSSRVVGLAHLDGCRCWPTRNVRYPVVYRDDKNKPHRLDYRQVIHLVDLASADQDQNERGFCAVSRVLKSGSVLRRFAQFKDEKLSTRPVPGLALASNITEQMLRDALTRADEEEITKSGRLVYRNIPILAALDVAEPVSLEMIEFRSVPDGFNIVEETTLFVYIVALAFGVDAREFWPATTTGATRGDALVQAQKAKGKGPGDLMSQLEWALNWKVLPPRLEFKFDFVDDEEDRQKAEIADLRVEVVRKMFLADPSTFEGIITRDEARNLLVSDGILPEEFKVDLVTEEETLYETEKAWQARAAGDYPRWSPWTRRLERRKRSGGELADIPNLLLHTL